MMTEKQLREIDEHYLKFRIFGYTFRWFSTSPLHIYNHIQRVKNRSISDVVQQRELLIAFAKWLNPQNGRSNIEWVDIEEIDDYLSNL